MLFADVCTNSTILKIIYFISSLINIIFLVIPIILIIMICVDFCKNVIASGEDDMKKNTNVAIKRIIMAVAMFFVPTIVNVAIGLLDDADIKYMSCFTNATLENIKYYEELEANQKLEDEATRVENETSDVPSSDPYSPSTGSGGSTDSSTPSTSNPGEYVKEPSTSNLKLYKTRTLYAIGGSYAGNSEKIQQFAITDIGTNNEIIWYAYQDYGNDNSATHISAYDKNDNRVYAAYIKNGGEGQTFDVVKKNNTTYTIYTGANSNSNSVPRNLYRYDVTPGSKYANTYDKLDYKDKGFSISKQFEASYDTNTNLLAIKTDSYNVKIYSYDDSKPLESSNIKEKYSFSMKKQTGGVNGSDLNGNYMYYVDGYNDFYVSCYNITNGKEIYAIYLKDVLKKVKSVCSQCTGNGGEIEGIKVYTYNGKKRIFIGYKAGSYNNSAILYFDY